MRISEKIKQYMPDNKYAVFNEKDVSTLGFFDCKEDAVCCFVGAKKFISKVPANAKMLIVPEDLRETVIESCDAGVITVEKPQKFFWDLHQELSQDFDYIRDTFENKISSSAKIAKYISIAPRNVVIEDDVVIEDFVTIYENTYIKRGSIIRSGSRIGTIGFQEIRDNGTICTMNHYGGVVIGENVDIQNNSCVDKGLFPSDDTVIGDETKIDNMVHIAHATKIGRRCEIAANAVIAGRCIIGDDVWIGLGALVRNFVTVGDNSRLNIGSVVVNDVHKGASVSGNYAIDHNKFMYEQLVRNRKR